MCSHLSKASSANQAYIACTNYCYIHNFNMIKLIETEEGLEVTFFVEDPGGGGEEGEEEEG